MTDRYVDHGNGTVTDRTTGLMWEQSPPDQRRTHAEAHAYCTGLQLGGHADWRLPTVQELVNLADYTRHDPAIDPLFTTAANDYWSATTYADGPSYAWYVYFTLGYVGFDDKGSDGYVRAVRAGSSILRSFDNSQAENAQLRAQLAQRTAALDHVIKCFDPLCTRCRDERRESVLRAHPELRALADLPDAPKEKPC
jgi:hypothetical protein